MDERTPEGCKWELEALQRLEAARTTIDALLGGHADLDPDVIAAVGRVVDAASKWAFFARAAVT